MRIDDQKKELDLLKERINTGLREYDDKTLLELVSKIGEDPMFLKLRVMDTDLQYFERTVTIWLKEYAKLKDRGIEFDIFDGIHSLEECTKKYMEIQYSILRIENNLEENYQEAGMHSLIVMHVSGIAILYVIDFETQKRTENILNVSQWLKKLGEYVQALLLLEEGAEYYGNDILCLEAANLYLECGCMEEAYRQLMKVKEPDENIRELISELGSMVNAD